MGVFFRRVEGVFVCRTCSSVKLPECSFVELLTVVPGQLSFCIASEVNRFDEATFLT